MEQVEIAVDVDDDYGEASIDEAWFKMGWNDTAFFLLLKRVDDDFATQWETRIGRLAIRQR
ncbi:MAG: hypothetical protein HC906_14660 [Bacteroidales bacterium]|nr:hypothetical protein [Bacteroidales bacterium]